MKTESANLPKTPREWVRAASSALLRAANAECGDPLHHAEAVVRSALGWDLTEYVQHLEDELTEIQTQRVADFVSGRMQGIPLQYLRGWEAFWKSQFLVGPGVLIPRPETELLVETVLSRVVDTGPVHLVELGAGTGIVGISLLLERSAWNWLAFEISSDAARFLDANLKSHPEVSARYRFEVADFFAYEPEAPVDVLVSNPPYIASQEVATLSKEVQMEPLVALDGGASGMDSIERLAAWGQQHLKVGGWIFLEIGDDQGLRTRDLFMKCSFSDVEIVQDAAGRDRVAVGRKAR